MAPAAPRPPATDPAEMDERTLRIIAVAVELAEKDGYDAVRIRDVAERADVALATVYRRFTCKEDILCAALDQQVAVASELIRGSPLPDGDAEARLTWFFREATDALAAQPKLSAAMLRTVASGVPELAERVTRYHGRMSSLILGVYKGAFDVPHTDAEHTFARLLMHVWFGALVGWTGGMHSAEEALAEVHSGVRLLLRAMPAAQAGSPAKGSLPV
jgi:AcrR family transcriptional regulator